jgi:hypothetical protein
VVPATQVDLRGWPCFLCPRGPVPVRGSLTLPLCVGDWSAVVDRDAGVRSRASRPRRGSRPTQVDLRGTGALFAPGTLLAALLWRSGRVGRVGLGAASGRGSFVSD